MYTKRIIAGRSDWHFSGLSKGALVVSLGVLIAPSNALGLAIGLIYAFRAGDNSQRLIPLVLSAALFLASFNATKVPEGDLYVYYLASEALRDADFQQLIFLHGHEPGYYFLNWLHVHLLGFDWNSWVFAFTFLIYFSWLNGVRLVTGFFHYDVALKVALIVWAAFLPLVFFQSAHLVRQYIALSFGLLGIAMFLATGRGWFWIWVAPLIHVSTLVLLLVPLSVWLAQRSRRLAMTLVVLGPLSMILIGRALGQNPERLDALGLPSIISYGIGRLSQNQFYELEGISISAVLFSMVSLGICMSAIAFRLPSRVSQAKEVSTRFAAFFAFGAAVPASALALSLAGFNEPATRLVQIVVLQLPFILAVILTSSHAMRLVTVATAVLMPISFFLYPSVWTYGNSAENLLLPYYYFLVQG